MLLFLMRYVETQGNIAASIFKAIVYVAISAAVILFKDSKN